MKYTSCILVILLLVSACKKTNDSRAVAPEEQLPGSYTANGMTYRIYSHSRSGCAPNYEVFSVAAYGWDEPARYLRISFSEQPLAGKSYRVGYKKYSTSYPAIGEVYIEAGQVNTLDIYASNGNEGVLATVSLLNGKRIITIPELTAHNLYDETEPEIKVSGQGIMLE